MHKVNASILRHGRHPSKPLTKRALSSVAPNPTVQITTLPNKIRVATESTPGHFSSVGLYIDAGSRYETPKTSGVSHFLDRMAFKSTSTRTDAEMSTAIHSLGGQIMCSSSRESMMYQSSHFHQATPIALDLISDTVLNPSFLPEEIEAQRDAAYYEIREISSKPDMILPEVLHSVAYGNQGLGNPLLCPEERIEAMSQSTLRDAMKDWYRPERMVIAGAGMHHQELVELVDKYFSSLKPSASQQPTISRLNSTQQVPPHLLSPSTPSVAKSLTRAASYLFPNPSSPSAVPKTSTSTYTGGHRFIKDTTAEFNHLYVAFEGVGIHDDDIYALATIQVLLGGGGSFSAGGPGKGMYSRLYTHILNHYPQIDHCASFHHIYTDSSLFGLFASFVPAASGLRGGNTPGQILPHLVHQLSLLLYSPIPAAELSRAKNQLKSSLMMALESRAVEVEDLGRQVLVHNRKVPVTEMTQKIDEVDPEKIREVAARIFGPESGNKATVVCMGHEDAGSWGETFTKYGIAGA
ncbi:Metalloenzyme, LuxS/M16 peptidase-like protein [Crucibulum laeve]|uniref:Alpha-MPP n=1 Tax=Crucibulum laeve TaxID=68775 RepID=A0A5C3MAS5_9AGAR|nr:Metalloenzyme, LuxS/M16 peptidase-like protein [Crucibulum laeve]